MPWEGLPLAAGLYLEELPPQILQVFAEVSRTWAWVPARVNPKP